MKRWPKVRILTVVFLLGIALLLVTQYIQYRETNVTLLTHCKNINRGDNVPNAGGCMSPISFKESVFIYKDPAGVTVGYLVITKRDGTFIYYELSNY